MSKIMEEEVVDQACYSMNLEIGRLGFSLLQLVYGCSLFISGMSEGNMNTDEASDSEQVETMMRRQMMVREEFRKADSLDRMKRLMEIIFEYKDTSYETGDRVYIQDCITSRWDGSAIVKHHQGNEVNVTHRNSELSVSNTRVRPYDDEVVESEDNRSTGEQDQVELDEEKKTERG